MAQGRLGRRLPLSPAVRPRAASVPGVQGEDASLTARLSRADSVRGQDLDHEVEVIGQEVVHPRLDQAPHQGKIKGQVAITSVSREPGQDGVRRARGEALGTRHGRNPGDNAR